ncbi:histidine phosphatase family protein [bacterium]|nr:MAG: histidine phosphatase family protein [bacterium]
MTMPVDLVLVRHGQSEQNLAVQAAKNGDISLITDEYRQTPDSQFRLSAKGRDQARETGEWLRHNGLGYFERRYVSDYVRAKETAGYLQLMGPDWYVDPSLREREWGSLEGLSWEDLEDKIRHDAQVRHKDPFYWVPPNGESIAQLTVRLRILLDTLHRECSDMRVVVVCHGEVMWALRFMLERMSVTTWEALESSQEPGVAIYNCQILHYTRRDPESGALAPHLDWMRSLCPCQPPNNGPGWQRIVRETFSNDELLDQASKSPHLFRVNY